MNIKTPLFSISHRNTTIFPISSTKESHNIHSTISFTHLTKNLTNRPRNFHTLRESYRVARPVLLNTNTELIATGFKIIEHNTKSNSQTH